MPRFSCLQAEPGGDDLIWLDLDWVWGVPCFRATACWPLSSLLALILSLAFREPLPSQSDPWASGIEASVGFGGGGVSNGAGLSTPWSEGHLLASERDWVPVYSPRRVPASREGLYIHLWPAGPIFHRAGWWREKEHPSFAKPCSGLNSFHLHAVSSTATLGVGDPGPLSYRWRNSFLEACEFPMAPGELGLGWGSAHSEHLAL